MGDTTNGLKVSDTEPETREPLPNQPSSPAQAEIGEYGRELGMKYSPGPTGDGLLSRPTLPKGRRSLFRR